MPQAPGPAARPVVSFRVLFWGPAMPEARDPRIAALIGVFVSRSVASSLVPPCLPRLADSYGVSYAGAGTLMATFFAAYTVAVLLASTWGRRVPRRTLLTAGAAFQVVATLGIVQDEAATTVSKRQPAAASSSTAAWERLWTTRGNPALRIFRAIDLPINPRPMYPTLSMADSLGVRRIFIHQNDLEIITLR